MILLSSALVLVCAVGATLAWLTDTTGEITNTFTPSDVDIELSESNNQYKMVPGYTIDKDPKVTVKANSEKCYVFVKLEESANFGTFMSYEKADGWTKLTGVDNVNNVWYREVNASDSAQSFNVIKDNQVKVKDTVTKEQMNTLQSNTYPTLKVTAYACQFNKSNNANFTPAEAWNNCQPANS